MDERELRESSGHPASCIDDSVGCGGDVLFQLADAARPDEGGRHAGVWCRSSQTKNRPVKPLTVARGDSNRRRLSLTTSGLKGVLRRREAALDPASVVAGAHDFELVWRSDHVPDVRAFCPREVSKQLPTVRRNGKRRRGRDPAKTQVRRSFRHQLQGTEHDGSGRFWVLPLGWEAGFQLSADVCRRREINECAGQRWPGRSPAAGSARCPRRCRRSWRRGASARRGSRGRSRSRRGSGWPVR